MREITNWFIECKCLFLQISLGWSSKGNLINYLFKAIMRNLWFQECPLICWQAMLKLQGFEQSSDMICLMFHFYRWMIMKYVLVLIWGIMHCMFVCYIWQNLPLCTYCNILQSFTSCRVDISRLTLDREFSWLNFLMHWMIYNETMTTYNR